MATKKTSAASAKKSSTDNAKKSAKTTVNASVQVVDKARIEFMKEILLWVVLAVCILLFLSNLGIGGVVGNAVSGFFFGVFGLIAYLFPLLLLLGTFFAVSNYGSQIAAVKLVSAMIVIVFVCVLIELLTRGADVAGGVSAYAYGLENKAGGGFLGGLLATGLVNGFGLIGAYVITLIVMIIGFILITERSLLGSVKKRRIRRKPVNDPEESRQERQERIRQDKQLQREAASAKEVPRSQRKINGVAFDTTIEERGSANPKKRDELSEIHMDPTDTMEVTDINRIPLKSGSHASGGTQEMITPEPIAVPEPTPMPEAILPSEPTPEKSRLEEKGKRPRKTAASTSAMLTSADEVAQEIAETAPGDQKPYVFPPLTLLNKSKTGGSGNTKAKANEMADKLEQTLRNFGINAEVKDITCGPTVTRYEVHPEVGVRVNRITNLADDIKLNLAVTDIRIEAPIPGKAAVGIEVPNKEKVMVTFEELVSSPEFTKAESKVTFCAGKDIAGNVITANIAKMPHLLIAGTTGSGKSVCINTIIMSILYKARPEEVKLIMIDPKVVELSIYNGIPHLLIPVVTDPKKAAGALHWAVTEMDDRYQKFADAGVRDIKSYNKKLAANHYQLPINSNGETEHFDKMPEMVVIVDELADLMMVAAKEVEESICRLAQKARAAGIYLILATQRPSVDVVTGLIKANMPSRIAFAVNSGVDSRTILDMFGAEKLLGNGDMLYYPQSISKPLRVQGAFVSDDEVQRVVDYIKGNNEGASYNEQVSQVIDMAAETRSEGTTAIGGGSGFDEGVDAYFAEAGRLVTGKEKGSIGMLQRNFKIGFNRAARIMDQLEEAGVVGPELGTKPRTVLMSPAEFERYLDPDYVGTSEDQYPIDDDLD
jgi:S-DNA-T family DNA segregation ATPase FtsK/SpoIIIE